LKPFDPNHGAGAHWFALARERGLKQCPLRANEKGRGFALARERGLKHLGWIKNLLGIRFALARERGLKREAYVAYTGDVEGSLSRGSVD